LIIAKPDIENENIIKYRYKKINKYKTFNFHVPVKIDKIEGIQNKSLLKKLK